MICQQLRTSGLKQALHITPIKDDTNCQQMVQHNPLMDDCGMFATLQAAISGMVQINHFTTHLRPNFDHDILTPHSIHIYQTQYTYTRPNTHTTNSIHIYKKQKIRTSWSMPNTFCAHDMNAEKWRILLPFSKQCQKISLYLWKQFNLGNDLTYKFWILAACPKSHINQNMF